MISLHLLLIQAPSNKGTIQQGFGVPQDWKVLLPAIGNLRLAQLPVTKFRQTSFDQPVFPQYFLFHSYLFPPKFWLRSQMSGNLDLFCSRNLPRKSFSPLVHVIPDADIGHRQVRAVYLSWYWNPDTLRIIQPQTVEKTISTAQSMPRQRSPHM